MHFNKSILESLSILFLINDYSLEIYLLLHVLNRRKERIDYQKKLLKIFESIIPISKFWIIKLKNTKMKAIVKWICIHKLEASNNIYLEKDFVLKEIHRTIPLCLEINNLWQKFRNFLNASCKYSWASLTWIPREQLKILRRFRLIEVFE